MCNIIQQLASALEPEAPSLVLDWQAGDTDVVARVYAPRTGEPIFECSLTASVARTYLETASMFTAEGEVITFEEFASLLDRIEASKAPPKRPATCTLGDAIQFMVDQLNAVDPDAPNAELEVKIGSATWLVTKR